MILQKLLALRNTQNIPFLEIVYVILQFLSCIFISFNAIKIKTPEVSFVFLQTK